MPRIYRPTRIQLRRAGLLTREGPGDPLMKRTLPGQGSGGGGGGGGGGDTNATGTATTFDAVTDVPAITIPLAANGTYFMDGRWVGRVTVDGAFVRGSSVAFQLWACVKRVDGAATVVTGTQTAAFINNEGVNGTPDYQASGNSVIVTIRGDGSDIAWKVSVNYFFV